MAGLILKEEYYDLELSDRSTGTNGHGHGGHQDLTMNYFTTYPFYFSAPMQKMPYAVPRLAPHATQVGRARFARAATCRNPFSALCQDKYRDR